MEQFPSAPGFHLLLGKVHESRGQDAKAFYEYQWELLRTGAERREGSEAAESCAALLKKNVSRELALLVSAVQQMQKDARRSRNMFDEIVRKHGGHFVVTLYSAEAAQHAGDTAGAIEIYRHLIAQDQAFVPAYVQLERFVIKSAHNRHGESSLSILCW